MKLAALVFLFSGITIQAEDDTAGHSSYIDAVSALGLAYMICAANGGYTGDSHHRLSTAGHPLLWESLPVRGNDRIDPELERLQTMRIVDAATHATRQDRIEIAERIWESLLKRAMRILHPSAD